MNSKKDRKKSRKNFELKIIYQDDGPLKNNIVFFKKKK